MGCDDRSLSSMVLWSNAGLCFRFLGHPKTSAAFASAEQPYGLVVPSHTLSSCGTSYCAMFDDSAVIVLEVCRALRSPALGLSPVERWFSPRAHGSSGGLHIFVGFCAHLFCRSELSFTVRCSKFTRPCGETHMGILVIHVMELKKLCGSSLALF